MKLSKKTKILFENTYQFGGTWKRKTNKLFYSLQQSTDLLQHPSLQQLLLHFPVLQPSLQQPSAQQVSLQQVSKLSINSFIIKLPLQ